LADITRSIGFKSGAPDICNKAPISWLSETQLECGNLAVEYAVPIGLPVLFE
jgi:hypothetical protein